MKKPTNQLRAGDEIREKTCMGTIRVVRLDRVNARVLRIIGVDQKGVDRSFLADEWEEYVVLLPLSLAAAIHQHDHGADAYLFLVEEGVMLEDDDAHVANLLKINFDTDAGESLIVAQADHLFSNLRDMRNEKGELLPIYRADWKRDER